MTARLAALAISLTFVSLTCGGGVNPGETHNQAPLPVHCSKQRGPTCIGATPS